MNEYLDDGLDLNDYSCIIVMAEYGKAFLWGQNELNGLELGECCGCYFPNMEEKSKTITKTLWEKFCDWHIQFEYIYFDYDESNLAFKDVNRTKPIDFDWFDFHKIGLKLTKQLRLLLSDNVRLFYQIPDEDFTTKDLIRVEFLNNGDILPIIFNADSNEWEYDYANQNLLDKFN